MVVVDASAVESATTQLDRLLGDPRDDSSVMSFRRSLELDRAAMFPAEAAAVLDARASRGSTSLRSSAAALAGLHEPAQLIRHVARRDLTAAVGHGKTFLGAVCAWVAGGRSAVPDGVDRDLRTTGVMGAHRGRTRQRPGEFGDDGVARCGRDRGRRRQVADRQRNQRAGDDGARPYGQRSRSPRPIARPRRKGRGWMPPRSPTARNCGPTASAEQTSAESTSRARASTPIR